MIANGKASVTYHPDHQCFNGIHVKDDMVSQHERRHGVNTFGNTTNDAKTATRTHMYTTMALLLFIPSDRVIFTLKMMIATCPTRFEKIG
jgi:hypothetical protein